MTLPPEQGSGDRSGDRPRRATRERAALAVALLAGAVPVSAWITAARDALPGDPVASLCAEALVTELWVAVLAVAVGLLAARPLRSSLGLAPGRLGAREIGILALGTLAASHALDGCLELSGLTEHSVIGELPRRLEGARGARLVAALLSLGIAPGIAEELLCRGLIQRGVARRLGPIAGVVAAALVFGALHVEPIHASFAALLGLYLGAAAHLSGSTRAPMVCHTLNNLLAVALAAFSGSSWASPGSTAVAAGIAAACLAWVVRCAPASAGSASGRPPNPAGRS